MGKLTLLGMLDLNAAFDCVDHDILIGRLGVSFGFGGAVLDWMRSYLVGRRQYIRYNGLTSSTTGVQFSVPQASGFRSQPIVLHIVYIWCFPYCRGAGVFHPRVCRRLTTLRSLSRLWYSPALHSARSLHRGHGPMDVQQSPQVKCFEDGNHLAGHDAPPGQMHLRPDHHQRRSNNAFLHGPWSRCLYRFWHELHESCHQADEDVLFSHSSAPVYQSVAHCGLFARPGSSTDPDATGLLQRTPWWAPKCLLSPLSRVMRAAARLILLLPRTSSVKNEIHTVLHWLDVPARATFKLCVLAHRCLHGTAPPYLVRYFTPVSSIVGRTHLRSAATGMLFVPRSQTSTIGPRAFAISSPSAWNSLPVDLRDPGLSLLIFRHRLKTYLFNPSGYLST